MAKCITCGTELHPERAKKYNYCMARECQEKNAKGLAMVAIGMNKAADELVILDERTREELAKGRYQDQRKVSSARPPRHRHRASWNSAQAAGTPAAARPARRPEPQPRRQAPARVPWSRKQEKLALLYNQQGMRPAEIAQKLGISSYLVAQIILAARNRGKA